MDNKVVAHLRDGRLIKGTTANFSPIRDKFHITMPNGKTAEVLFNQLKALFFVKRLDGNRSYRETKGLGGAHGVGRKVRCDFSDGEVLAGFTQAYDPTRAGLFITPSDPKSNNERIFVVTAATKSVSFLP